MNHPNPIIFDKHRIALHHARATEDFLLREMCERLADRLEDINHRFPHVLDISAKEGVLVEYLPKKSGIEHSDFASLKDEYLDFPENHFDLVMSVGNLHWVNDVVGVLAQIKRILKPDGLFLAMLPGGETLKELRTSFEAAEMQLRGGISPRVSPFIDVRDAGSLLQRAGFSLPVVDREVMDVSYEHPLKLLHELRNMGQSNALISSQKTFTSCTLMMAMCDYYLQHFSAEEGRIRATFEMVTMTAWKPHASQQQPAKRGSGKVTLLSSPPPSGDTETNR